MIRRLVLDNIPYLREGLEQAVHGAGRQMGGMRKIAQGLPVGAGGKDID
jgi:hypothetical protein